MAVDAADRLRALLAAGEEIPYEVHEPGDGSPLCRYEPQTELFVRDHAGELRELDSFGRCCAAIEAAGLASGYLQELGIAVPPEPRPRAELAGIVFLCRLWMDSSDFSLEDERLDLRSRSSRPGSTSTPARSRSSSRSAACRCRPPGSTSTGASIVRADTVDVPPEARSSDGLGISPWETPFLAVVRVSEHPRRRARRDGRGRGLAAVESFRRLITTLRLFKAGGRRPRPARLDPARRRSLAPDRDRLRAPPPRRLPADRGRARRARRVLARAAPARAPPSRGLPTIGRASRSPSGGR